MEKVKFRSEKLKGTFRDNNAKLSFEKDIGTTPYGFSWAQRNYRCSFCKKEFKSAQALGGHMNVHRRDRAAKMRLSPSSLDCLNFNPNNYSNFSSSSSSPSYHAPNKLTPNYMTHHATSFTSFFSPSPASINEEKVPIMYSSRDHHARRYVVGKNLKKSALLEVRVLPMENF